MQTPPELGTIRARSLSGEQEEPQSFTLQQQGRVIYKDQENMSGDPNVVIMEF